MLINAEIKKIKKQINNMDISEDIKLQLINLIDNSSDGEEISDNNSDINMTDYDSNYDSDSEEIECNCDNLEQCSCNMDHQLYLIQSQFKENLTINVISNDIADLLKEVNDPEIRQKILDNLNTKEHNIKEEGIYSMKNVHNMLRERRNKNSTNIPTV